MSSILSASLPSFGFLSETFPSLLLPYSQDFFLRIYEADGPYFQALRLLGFKIPTPLKIVESVGSTLYWNASSETFFFLKYFSPELVSECPNEPLMFFSQTYRHRLVNFWKQKHFQKCLSQKVESAQNFLTCWPQKNLSDPLPSSLASLLQEFQDQEIFCFSTLLPSFFFLHWKRIQRWQEIQKLSTHLFSPERACLFLQSLMRKIAEMRFTALLQNYPQQSSQKISFQKKFGYWSTQPLEISTPRWSEKIVEAEKKWLPPTDFFWNSFEKELPFMIHGESILQQLQKFFTLSNTCAQFYEFFLQILHRIHFLLTSIQEKTTREVFYLTSSEIQKLAQNQYNEKQVFERKKMLQQNLERSVPTLRNISSSNFTSAFTLGQGLVAGKVTGEVLWAERPSLPFSQYQDKILWTRTLHPGWIPVLLQVRGVLLTQTPLFSDACQLLNILQIPSISGIYPEKFTFVSGEVIQLDGMSGTVSKVSSL